MSCCRRRLPTGSTDCSWWVEPPGWLSSASSTSSRAGSVVDVWSIPTTSSGQALRRPRPRAAAHDTTSPPAATSTSSVLRSGAQQYDKVIVLGYRRGLTPPEADAFAALASILQQALVGVVGKRPRIVTELLDGDVDLARATGADDFVVSDELSSLDAAQLAERSDLEGVFAD